MLETKNFKNMFVTSITVVENITHYAQSITCMASGFPNLSMYVLHIVQGFIES